MAKFYVELPVMGKVGMEVEADSAEEAIERAFDVDPTDDNVADLEWETCKWVVQGNVFSGPLSEAYAELMDDDE